MKSIYRLILCISRNTCFIHRVQLLISRVDTPRRTTSSFVSFLPYLRPVAEVAVIQRRSNATLPSCLEHLQSLRMCQFVHKRLAILNGREISREYFENRATHLFPLRFGRRLLFPFLL